MLLASCLINLCIGTLYAWSVFSAPMADYLSSLNGVTLTAVDLAIVFSIGNSSGFITMIGGGFLNRKIGPRWVVCIGGVLFGLGFVLCGFARSVSMLIAGYGIISGLSMGLAYGCTISNSVKFFPDKAGLVGGIATASYGISSVLVPPIANALINTLGVCGAFRVLGVVIIVVVGIFSQFIKACPADFVPAGWTPPAAAKSEKLTVPDKTWQQMLHEPVFYVMLIMLFFGASMGMMVISQASGIAQRMTGMDAATAAIIVSVLALFNTAGRIAAGWVSDRIGCINTISGVFVLAIAAMGLLYADLGTAAFCVGICMVGICFGAFMGVYPSFTAGQFGRKNSSINYGIMFIGFNAAGLIGPLLMGSIFKAAGSYAPAFLLALAFAGIGLAMSFAYRAIEKRGC